MKMFENLKNLDFKKMRGLIPVIVQDNATKSVLMLGFMNKTALNRTIKTKLVTFFSRSRQCLWQKGETSGNFLRVVKIYQDCDRDTLLITVKPKGPTCHTGKYSCFGNLSLRQTKGDGSFFKILYRIIKERKRKLPDNSYTASLFKAGLKKILAKVEEESKEVIKATKKESRQRLVEESCDLLYHLLVLLAEKNIDLTDIEKELNKRHSKSLCKIGYNSLA